MGALESETLNITKDALKYAKIISSSIEEVVNRKRAFASIVVLDTFADYLLTKGIEVNISKNLFKIAPVNAEFEISDIYYNGWKLDVRVVGDDGVLTIPQMHFKSGITADFYVVMKMDKELNDAVILGYIDSSLVNKKSKNESYYLVNIEELAPCEDLIEKLKTVNDSVIEYTEHDDFEKFYLAYIDNEIKVNSKKRLIKHLVNCKQCRESFVEFFDFETIVTNSKNYPEIFEDKTLGFIGGTVAEDEKYEGQEVIVNIAEEEQNNNGGRLPSGVVIPPVMLAGAAMNLGITPSITPSIEINTRDSHDSKDDLKEIADFSDIEANPLSEEEVDFIIEDNDLPDEDTQEEVLLDSDEKIEIEDYTLSDKDALTEVLNSEEDDILKEYEFLNTYDESNLNEKDETNSIDDFFTENDSDELLEHNDSTEFDFLSESVEDKNAVKDADQDSIIEVATDFSEEFSNTDDDETFINDGLLENANQIFEEYNETENLADSFDKVFQEEILSDEESIEDDYQEIDKEFNIVEETNENEFLASEIAEEDISEQDLDDIFDVSQIAAEQEAENDSSEVTELNSFKNILANENVEDDFHAFINASEPEVNISEESFLNLSNNEISLSKDNKFEDVTDSDDIKVLFDKNENVQSSEDSQPDEFKEVVSNESNEKDKKMIMLASIITCCVLLATILGVSLFIRNNNKKAELVNNQILNQIEGNAATQPLPEDTGAIPPLDTQDVLKESSASTPKDMNKVMTNVFSDTPSSVTITKIAWEVPQSLAKSTVFAKFLQLAGQNLQLNLKSDLINATEFAYNDKINIEIVVTGDSKIKDVKVLSSSGSTQIDQIVLQSIKETLKYINVPPIAVDNKGAVNSPAQSASPNSNDKNKFYNLKLAINF